MHHDLINTKQIILNPVSEHDKVKNFKIFEKAIQVLKLDVEFHIEKLVKCR